MRMKFLKVALGTVSFLALSAQADGLETLVVTGDREGDLAEQLPGAARLAMDRQQPGLRIDSAELLQGLPGVQADSRSNYAQDTRLTLRGFGARSAFGVRGIDLQMDGIPLSTPDGQGQLSSLMVDDVESVQVLRGPLAALYGNGAGGVIRFDSRPPESNRLGVRLLAGDGDRQRQALSGQWASGNWGARLRGSRFQSDGERPHAEAERRHGGAQVYHRADSGIETVVRLDTSEDPLLQDPLGLSPEQWRENPEAGNDRAETFNTRKSIRHRQGSVSLRQRESENRWQLALWRGQREVNQWLAFPGGDITSSGAVIDLTRDFSGARGSYTRDLTLAGTPLEATVGISLEQMDDRRRGYVNDNGETGDLRRDELGEVDSRDLYGILSWAPAERWELTGGLRHSDLDFSVDDDFIVPPEGDSPGNPDDSGGRDYDFLSGALGVEYQVNARWQAYASAGRGHETPTLTETAYRNEGSGLNTALDPTVNDQGELGLRFTPADEFASLDMSLFQIDSEDELVVDQSEGGRTTYRNAAATERWGLEASGELSLAPAWWARFSASYLDAEYSEGPWQGNQLPGIAETNLYAQLRWEPLLDDRLGLALVSRYRSEIATGDDNETFAPSATLWDLSVDSHQQWGDWTLEAWAKAANLTDETYVGSVIVNQGSGRSFEPAPGRNLSAGLNIDYRW